MGDRPSSSQFASADMHDTCNDVSRVASILSRQVYKEPLRKFLFTYTADSDLTTSFIMRITGFISSIFFFVIIYLLALFPDSESHWTSDTAKSVQKFIQSLFHVKLNESTTYINESFLYKTPCFYIQMIIAIMSIVAYAGFIKFHRRQFNGKFFSMYMHIYGTYLGPSMLLFSFSTFLNDLLYFIYSKSLCVNVDFLQPMFLIISLPALIVVCYKEFVQVSVNQLPFNSLDYHYQYRWYFNLIIMCCLEQFGLIYPLIDIYLEITAQLCIIFISFYSIYISVYKIPFMARQTRIISQALSVIFLENVILSHGEQIGIKNSKIVHSIIIILNFLTLLFFIVYHIWVEKRITNLVLSEDYTTFTERQMILAFTYMNGSTFKILATPAVVDHIKNKFILNSSLRMLSVRFLSKACKNPEKVFLHSVQLIESTHFSTIQCSILIELSSDMISSGNFNVTTARQKQLKKLIHKCYKMYKQFWLYALKDDSKGIMRIAYQLSRNIHHTEMFFNHFGINENVRGPYQDMYIEFLTQISGSVPDNNSVNSEENSIISENIASISMMHIPQQRNPAFKQVRISKSNTPIHHKSTKQKLLYNEKIEVFRQADSLVLPSQNLREYSSYFIYIVGFLLSLVGLAMMFHEFSELSKLNDQIYKFVKVEITYFEAYYAVFLAKSGKYADLVSFNYSCDQAREVINSNVQSIKENEQLFPYINSTFLLDVLDELSYINDNKSIDFFSPGALLNLSDLMIKCVAMFINESEAQRSRLDNINYMNGKFHSYSIFKYVFVAITIPLMLLILVVNNMEIEHFFIQPLFIDKTDVSTIYHKFCELLSSKGRKEKPKLYRPLLVINAVVAFFSLVIIYALSFIIPQFVISMMSSVKQLSRALLTAGYSSSLLFSGIYFDISASTSPRTPEPLVVYLDMIAQQLCNISNTQPKLAPISVVSIPQFTTSIVSTKLFSSMSLQITSKYLDAISEIIYIMYETISLFDTSDSYLSMANIINLIDIRKDLNNFYDHCFQEFLWQTETTEFTIIVSVVFLCIVSGLVFSVAVFLFHSQDRVIQTVSRIIVMFPFHNPFFDNTNHKIITFKKEDNRMYDNIIDKFPAGFIAVSKKGRLVYYNKVAFEYYGSSILKENANITSKKLRSHITSDGVNHYFAISKSSMKNFPMVFCGEKPKGCYYYVVFDETKLKHTATEIDCFYEEYKELRNKLLNASVGSFKSMNPESSFFLDRFAIMEVILPMGCPFPAYLQLKEKLFTVPEIFPSTLFVSVNRFSIFLIFSTINSNSRVRQHIRDALKCSQFVDDILKQLSIADGCKVTVTCGTKCVGEVVNGNISYVRFYSKSILNAAAMMRNAREGDILYECSMLKNYGDITLSSDHIGQCNIMNTDVEYRKCHLGSIQHEVRQVISQNSTT